MASLEHLVVVEFQPLLASPALHGLTRGHHLALLVLHARVQPALLHLLVRLRPTLFVELLLQLVLLDDTSLDRRVSCAQQELIKARPPLLALLVPPVQVESHLLTLQQVARQSLLVPFARQDMQAQFNALRCMPTLPSVQELLWLLDARSARSESMR